MMKTTSIARSIELAKAAAKIGLQAALSGGAASKIEQAKILAESLSQLKGAAMKAGQLLSLDLLDYFPKEAVEILGKLQNSASHLPFDEIQALVKKELGAKKFAEIESISREPIGSASIGQVHRARIGGREMVLKVQYPGVADSIEADLRILKSVASGFCNLTGREMDLTPLFVEFRSILRQEVDYSQEADLQERYGNQARALNGNSDLSFVVPRVERRFSTERLICMEWEEGETLRDWIRRDPPISQKKLLAHAFLNLYFHEFFSWGLVQTDPNQANFLVRNKGRELVLLDFGATRTYDRAFIRRYVKLLEVTGSQDRKKLKRHAIDFGIIDERESDEAFESLFQMLIVAVAPFFSPDGSLLRESPFDFSDENHLRRSQTASRELAAQLKYSPPPRELVFLHRKLGGIYAALKSLGVKINVAPYWRQMQELADGE